MNQDMKKLVGRTEHLEKKITAIQQELTLSQTDAKKNAMWVLVHKNVHKFVKLLLILL